MTSSYSDVTPVRIRRKKANNVLIVSALPYEPFEKTPRTTAVMQSLDPQPMTSFKVYCIEQNINTSFYLTIHTFISLFALFDKHLMKTYE